MCQHHVTLQRTLLYPWAPGPDLQVFSIYSLNLSLLKSPSSKYSHTGDKGFNSGIWEDTNIYTLSSNSETGARYGGELWGWGQKRSSSQQVQELFCVCLQNSRRSHTIDVTCASSWPLEEGAMILSATLQSEAWCFNGSGVQSNAQWSDVFHLERQMSLGLGLLSCVQIHFKLSISAINRHDQKQRKERIYFSLTTFR